MPLGRYLKLAADNADHFGEWALSAYMAGHTAALQQAVVAPDRHRPGPGIGLRHEQLCRSLLTDLFSAGHLRVPRKQLAAVVTPGELGSLISRFMHDEDSKFGLKVRNAMGAQWHAYGDKRYFDSIDADNRVQVKEAVQASADEIFETFISGIAPSPAEFKAPLYVPDLNAAQNPANNFSPLFKMEGTRYCGARTSTI